MYVVIAWWDLAASDQTVASLRPFLREEAVPRFSAVPGLLLKTWISDEENGRWGAVFLWESREAAQQPIPARAAELIGHAPALRLGFDVEATVEGIHDVASLSGLGAVFA